MYIHSTLWKYKYIHSTLWKYSTSTVHCGNIISTMIATISGPSPWDARLNVYNVHIAYEQPWFTVTASFVHGSLLQWCMANCCSGSQPLQQWCSAATAEPQPSLQYLRESLFTLPLSTAWGFQEGSQAPS